VKQRHQGARPAPRRRQGDSPEHFTFPSCFTTLLPAASSVRA